MNLHGSLLGATADGHGSGGCSPPGHVASYHVAARNKDKKVRRKKRSLRPSYKLGRGRIHVTYFGAVVENTVLIQSLVGSLATGFA